MEESSNKVRGNKWATWIAPWKAGPYTRKLTVGSETKGEYGSAALPYPPTTLLV